MVYQSPRNIRYRRYSTHYKLQYPVLTNQIDSRNKFHLEFIEWLGFDVYNRTEPEVFGGVDFFAFRITPELYKERWCK